jgi:hypothetical protein
MVGEPSYAGIKFVFKLFSIHLRFSTVYIEDGGSVRMMQLPISEIIMTIKY